MDDEKNSGGRPLKFASKEILQALIDAYFALCDKDNVPYTITGLALALDTSRETLSNYEKKAEFFDTVKRAKTRVENYAEKRLFTSTNVTGPIFALKNFGWKDKIESESVHTIKVMGTVKLGEGKKMNFDIGE
jgi:hypothetical protein